MNWMALVLAWVLAYTRFVLRNSQTIKYEWVILLYLKPMNFLTRTASIIMIIVPDQNQWKKSKIIARNGLVLFRGRCQIYLFRTKYLLWIKIGAPCIQHDLNFLHIFYKAYHNILQHNCALFCNGVHIFFLQLTLEQIFIYVFKLKWATSNLPENPQGAQKQYNISNKKMKQHYKLVPSSDKTSWPVAGNWCNRKTCTPHAHAPC